jgi:hypothetical protein
MKMARKMDVTHPFSTYPYRHMAKQKLDWSRATRKSGLHAVGMATPDGRMWLGTATCGSKSTTLEPYK